jgi:hypothetical protein
MNDDFIFYRNARGKWRLYWISQLPILFTAFFIINYWYYIGLDKSVKSFGYIPLIFSIGLQLIGFIQLLGFKVRVASLNMNGIILRVDPLDKSKEIDIGWDKISSAKIAGRDFRQSINLLRFGGPVSGEVESNKEVLVLKLKSTIPGDIIDIMNVVKNIFPPRLQISCNDNGDEIWISETPRGGYSQLLEIVLHYLSPATDKSYIKHKKTRIKGSFTALADILLGLFVVTLTFLSITA